MTIEVGDKFAVTEAVELRDKKRNRLISRLLPDFSYTVTPRNLPYVLELVDAGKAVKDGAPQSATARNEMQARRASAKGTITVK